MLGDQVEDRSQIIGQYSANVEDGFDRLTIFEDSTFIHESSYSSYRGYDTVSQSGNWQHVVTIQGLTAVSLRGYRSQHPEIIDAISFSGSRGKLNSSIIHEQLGYIRIVISSDLGLEYRKKVDKTASKKN